MSTDSFLTSAESIADNSSSSGMLVSRLRAARQDLERSAVIKILKTT